MFKYWNNGKKSNLISLGRVSLVTRGPYGMIYEIPNPTPFRNP